jgi:hypothetical protein
MPKRVAILQSNYIPWKGYFDLIHDVDELVFLDDVQYTRQDWRNRNRIKTHRGPVWLTIPVGTDLNRRICDVALPSGWAESHWRRLRASYEGAPYFETYQSAFESIYLSEPRGSLSELNQTLIRMIATQLLGITTRFSDSRELGIAGRGEQRVLDIVQRLGATVYVSGPAAKAYLDPDRFAASGVTVRWKDYSGYPLYPQLHPPFTHAVTVLDLLFHTGPKAPWYIWGWRTSDE